MSISSVNSHLVSRLQCEIKKTLMGLSVVGVLLFSGLGWSAGFNVTDAAGQALSVVMMPAGISTGMLSRLSRIVVP